MAFLSSENTNSTNEVSTASGDFRDIMSRVLMIWEDESEGKKILKGGGTAAVCSDAAVEHKTWGRDNLHTRVAREVAQDDATVDARIRRGGVRALGSRVTKYLSDEIVVSSVIRTDECEETEYSDKMRVSAGVFKRESKDIVDRAGNRRDSQGNVEVCKKPQNGQRTSKGRMELSGTGPPKGPGLKERVRMAALKPDG
ncbi:hypothetical protein Tco_0004131 [Tanacetum coccineum]